MPELPEVETTRRHLDAVMSGHTMTHIAVGRDRAFRHNGSPGEVEQRLKGRRIKEVGRHGKFLVIPLDDGQTFVAHLGMSGRWVIDGEVEKHTHFSAQLDNGTSVSFVDPRTFGFIAVYDEDSIADSGLSRLGPDAWNGPVTADELHSILSTRTAPIKALLLDQSVVAGLGNIYADEVLFRSGVHPLTPGKQVQEDQVTSILSAVHDVLAAAIENGGTTLDDLAYLLPDGRAGENIMSLAVYGRADQPCFVCGSAIERVVVRSRSSHYCPGCQVIDG